VNTGGRNIPSHGILKENLRIMRDGPKNMSTIVYNCK
jgi:hypothetical protein